MKQKLKILGGVLIGFVIVSAASLFSIESYTARSDFCGTSCHIMKEPYLSWQNSKHGEEGIACVTCHYAPGEKFTIRAKFKGLGQLFTYLSTDEKEVRKRPHVDDRSCLQAGCHTKDQYAQKVIKYTERVSFTHKIHEEKTIEGQTLHCSTCHRHNPFAQRGLAEGKHMEVSQESCFLCHFKNTEFAEGRATCSACHEIPDKPIVQLAKIENSEEISLEGAINHKTLEEKKVPCVSCHLQIVKGNGVVKQEKCLNCHDNRDSIMEQWNKKSLVHEEHVSAQTADCFNCHETIQHKNQTKDFDHLDVALADCRECHAEPHLHQRQLLAGIGGHGMEKPYPIKHFDVNVNCTGCHNEASYDEKGRKIKAATAETCVNCHTEKERVLIETWKNDVADFFIEARDIEKEALDALAAAKDQLSEATVQDALTLLKQGQENLRIVEAGGGVHNKKYSVSLIDVAIINFEDVIDMLDTN